MRHPRPDLTTFCGLVIHLIVAATCQAGRVLYVNAAATGNNHGDSWPNAYTNLQNALNIAQNGDEIWVAAGTYKPSTRSSPSDPRSAAFRSYNAASIYGGFAGGETARDQRDWTANVTTLSGDVLGNDDGTPDGRSDNCYLIVVSGSVLMIDGFTVTAANNDSNYYGGAINAFYT
jgi:hypothetical protein